MNLKMYGRKRCTFSRLAILLALSGCVSAPPPMSPNSVALRELPPSREAARQVIGIEDVLAVRVYRESELSFDRIRVDSDGNINFPLVGTIKASGKTAAELSSEIEARLLEQFLAEPRVTVTVLESVRMRVTVDGAVAKPGVFPIVGSMSLIQAIAMAEGLSDVARRTNVLVLRPGAGATVSAARFDLDAVRAGREPNITLDGGDTVIVGESGVKRVYQDLLKLAPALTSVFIRVL